MVEANIKKKKIRVKNLKPIEISSHLLRKSKSKLRLTSTVYANEHGS